MTFWLKSSGEFPFMTPMTMTLEAAFGRGGCCDRVFLGVALGDDTGRSEHDHGAGQGPAVRGDVVASRTLPRIWQ